MCFSMSLNASVWLLIICSTFLPKSINGPQLWKRAQTVVCLSVWSCQATCQGRDPAFTPKTAGIGYSTTRQSALNEKGRLESWMDPSRCTSCPAIVVGGPSHVAVYYVETRKICLHVNQLDFLLRFFTFQPLSLVYFLLSFLNKPIQVW